MSVDRATSVSRSAATRRGALLHAALFLLVSPALIAGLVLTLSRLTDDSNGRALRIESFTPFGIPLYAALLVVSLVGLVLVPRAEGARPVWRVVALLALVGLALHLAWFSPRMVGSNPPPAPDAVPITVMTANVFAGNVPGDEIVRAVEEQDVDVLVLAEVTTAEVAEMDEAGISELLPFRIGGSSDYDADGTMVFSRLTMGLATPLETGHESWRVDVDGLSLMAVHPFSPTVSGKWRADHAVIGEAAERLQPDLIVGDFNATLDHQPMQDLASAGWRSAAERTNAFFQPTWPANGLIRAFGFPVPPMVQIDHVLVGPRMAAISVDTVTLPGSDHLAVVAQVARR
ncbi:endonuclease/exonuclease/phosphatase family protein [Nocardioides sp.]|uniref:endonuclease/exonuclease/phosphatase family protein n=1 Tax=Nocardioides sp. TaxID=35761 RepID=UPI0035624F08